MGWVAWGRFDGKEVNMSEDITSLYLSDCLREIAIVLCASANQFEYKQVISGASICWI